MVKGKTDNSILEYIPLPACFINAQGKVTGASARINEVFVYDEILEGDIFALTGIKLSELYESAAGGTHPLIKRNDKTFRISAKKLTEDDEDGLAVFFSDVTNLEDLKDRYNNEKPCVAKIQLDNYDELIDSTGPVPRLALSSQIDGIIRKWAAKMDASVIRVKSSLYVVWFEQQHLEKIIAAKFDLLDEVRNLETGADFPASLSIGVGVGGRNMAQSESYADTALDLALGRGGDQAVIKRNIKIEYYGGKLQTVEKSNKGKSRIVGHALKQLIEQSKKIFIMGHDNPDMDSFGSALGITRLCVLCEKEPYLVIDEVNESLQEIFKQAKEKAPCIVFIDEIDTIGKKRDGSGMGGGNDEREQTLNQLLTEMDGFDGSKGVVILAATNRPDSLDPALLRPGRFDRRIPVELPDLQGREEILKVHAKKIKIADTVRFDEIAKAAVGASGAELANIVNEAALRAVRDGRKFATQADFEESIEVVIAGYQKKNAILTDREKMIVSYHEIGHALVAAHQSHSAPVQKITIIPRTSGALGYTMQVDEGNHYLMSKEEIENKIATFTGGRAAEEIAIGSVTTGASNDIEQATRLARAMITQYGMSEEFDMVALETVTNQYLGGDASLACSAETQTKIDAKVTELVKKQHEKARRILLENRQKLDELAQYLYAHETITGDEFMRILNA